jgi:hypothetical protein
VVAVASGLRLHDRLRHKVDGPDEVPMIYNIRGAGFILREAASYAAA